MTTRALANPEQVPDGIFHLANTAPVLPRIGQCFGCRISTRVRPTKRAKRGTQPGLGIGDEVDKRLQRRFSSFAHDRLMTISRFSSIRIRRKLSLYPNRALPTPKLSQSVSPGSYDRLNRSGSSMANLSGWAQGFIGAEANAHTADAIGRPSWGRGRTLSYPVMNSQVFVSRLSAKQNCRRDGSPTGTATTAPSSCRRSKCSATTIPRTDPSSGGGLVCRSYRPISSV